MTQLVGQPCMICRRTIGRIGDSRFCPECNAPVHNECATTAAAAMATSACPACGYRRRPHEAPFPSPKDWEAARARSRRNVRVVLAAVFGVWLAVVAAVFAVLVVVAIIATNRKEESSRKAAAVEHATAGQEGEAWEMHELFAYLEAKGAISSGRIIEHGGDGQPSETVFITADKRNVRVRQLADARAAAADSRTNPGDAAFSWGRFSFAGDVKACEQFRQFLHD